MENTVTLQDIAAAVNVRLGTVREYMTVNALDQDSISDFLGRAARYGFKLDLVEDGGTFLVVKAVA